MQPIQKTLKLHKTKYYELHLNIINNFLPVQMTPKEIEVLSIFMSFDGELAEKARFGSTARKLVKEKMKITTAGLSNYMRTLKEKGFITGEDETNYNILPILIPEKEEQIYMFKFINFGDDRGNR